MKINQWHVVVLCIFSWGMGFLTHQLQQDKMTVKGATPIVAAHDACTKNAADGFCYMTFENYMLYFEAVSVVENEHD